MNISIEGGSICVQDATPFELEHIDSLISDLFYGQAMKLEVGGTLFLWDGEEQPFSVSFERVDADGMMKGPIFDAQKRAISPWGVKSVGVVYEGYWYKASPAPFDAAYERMEWLWPVVWVTPQGPQKMSGSEHLYRSLTNQWEDIS
jgi:hypothetical protein